MSELLSTNQPKGQSVSANEVLDLLGDDKEVDLVDKTEDKTDKVAKPKTEDKTDDKEDDNIDLNDDEDDEDKEDKINLKEKSGEADEDIEITAPPKKQELLKAFPDLFTKFPWFEKMLFRDRQYSEMFGSVDDAKEAIDKVNGYEAFERDLIEGNTEKVLKSVKDLDPKAWDKIVDNYLPTLLKIDREAYIDVVSNIGKGFIKRIFEQGKTNNDEELQTLAAGLNKWLFGNTTLEPIKQRSKEQPKDNELEQERKSFNQERLATAQGELGSKIENVLKSTISEYIDPKDEMSAYVKKNAIRDCLNELHNTISRDPAFVKGLNKLWETAFSDKFSQNSLGRIRATYLGRSKRELGPIIKRVRAEAQKEVSSKKKEEDKEEESPRRRGPIPAGTPRQSGGKNEMKKGESVSDFFMRE